ncbi:nucleoside recognition domain-containing protein [Archangium sp.]|uniref:nucleoside recognition domain-containing protein n=1 Tax=Archangium sp. TaxID=1872627 RepID=UPI002D29BBD5|nr:nucleoside recognition domain-containing protein [Archangium sp.]HYO57743.1 nucleoside recognition domain-containing protein [Archangium sp.]
MKTYLVSVLTRSRRLFVDLVKTMLPVMVIVQIASELGLVGFLAKSVGPLAALGGLPAEAGIVWITCALTGIYGGVGALLGLASSMTLDMAQFNALCTMMLFAHFLPVEQAVVRKAGVNLWITGALRLVVGLAYAAVVTWLSRLTGLLSQPADLSRLAVPSPAEAGYLAWILDTARSFAMLFVVIAGLLVLLDILDRTGITRRITRLLEPLLRVSGLDASVAPVTTVGVLLGLTYGGALIIQEAREKVFPPRTRFLALTWLSLSHSLLEDTAIMLAIGADVVVVLVGRVLVTLLVVGLLAKLLARLPEDAVWRWFLSRAAA